MELVIVQLPYPLVVVIKRRLKNMWTTVERREGVRQLNLSSPSKRNEFDHSLTIDTFLRWDTQKRIFTLVAHTSISGRENAVTIIWSALMKVMGDASF